MEPIESEQPKFKRQAIFCGMLLVVWVGAAIIVALLKVTRIEFVAVAGAIGCVLFAVAIVYNLTKLSNARRADTLRELGFEVLPTIVKFWRGATTELPPEIESIFRDAAGVGKQGQIFFGARRVSENEECWLIRHMVQHGKSTTIRNAFVVPHVTRWPITRFHRRGITDVFRKVFGDKPVILADTALNEKVTLLCKDEEFANLLMGPELSQIALSMKSWDQIVIGEGGVCVVTLSMLGDEKLRELFELIHKVRAAIPPELSEWEPRAIVRE